MKCMKRKGIVKQLCVFAVCMLVRWTTSVARTTVNLSRQKRNVATQQTVPKKPRARILVTSVGLCACYQRRSENVRAPRNRRLITTSEIVAEYIAIWCLSHTFIHLLSPPRRICNRRCLFVCLSVSIFAQKLPNGFAWNFMGQWTND